MHYDLITILGPTASGKTAIAVQLAKDFNGEIISADSRQVYKGMDIGTGKDLDEYIKFNIKYHLIDIIDPMEEYNLFWFTRDFHSAFQKINRAKRIPILTGGTGLYLSAVLQSYHLPEIENINNDDLNSLTINELRKILVDLKPKQHNITDLKSKARIIQAILIERSPKIFQYESPKLNSLTIGIKLSRDEIKNRITKRLKQRLSYGMIDEVKDLKQKGLSKAKLDYFGLEYKFVGQYIDGQINYNDMFQKLNSAIHNFAKRQMTWFRKMEREGVEINWFSPENYSEIKRFVQSQLHDARKSSK